MDLLAVSDRARAVTAAVAAPAVAVAAAQPFGPLPASVLANHAALLRDALASPHVLPQPHSGVRAGGLAPLDFGTVIAPEVDTSPYASLHPPKPPRVLYRSTQVHNTGDVPVMLLSLRLEPASEAYSLFDDHNVGGAESSTGVLLPPGAAYEATVQLSCAAGASGGVLSAWLLCTLAAANDASRRPFVLGRRVVAVVLSETQQGAMNSCFAFNPDARPFVPARLRMLFDAPVPQLRAHAALGAVPGAWLHATSTVIMPCGELDTGAFALDQRSVAARPD